MLVSEVRTTVALLKPAPAHQYPRPNLRWIMSLNVVSLHALRHKNFGML